MGRLQPASKVAAAIVAVAVASGIVLMLTGGGDNAPVVSAPTPDSLPAADAFFEAWENENWTVISRLVSKPESPAAEQLEQWRAEIHVTDVRFETGEPQVTDETAGVPFRVFVEIDDIGAWEYDSVLPFVWMDGSWLVEWDETIMHPSLGQGDRLDLITTWPERGAITDTNGRALTRSIPRVVVGLVPERIVTREEVFVAFDEVFAVSSDDIAEILDGPGVQPDWFLPVATVDRENYADVRPALFPVPGVTFRLVHERSPIDPGGAAALVGTTGEVTAESLAALGRPYTVGSIVGTSGLEASFERMLAGTPTRRIVRRAPDGSTETIATFPGTPASDLETTLSFEVQRAAEAALRDVGLPASLVVVDVDTGEIRAAASTPANGFRRSTNGLYPPGSTFKIVVAAALLEDGLHRGAPVSCPTVINVSGKEFGNAVALPMTMAFEEAFARSCNTFFIQSAIDLGPEVIAQSAQKFGFSHEIEIGIATADPSFVVSADPVENAAAAIGQGKVLATPLSLAVMAATAASGVWHPPTLIRGGDSESEFVLAPHVVADLALMMTAVVERGTGTAAAVEGLSIAGKTGTAQVSTSDGASTVAWFVGFSGDLAFAVNVEGGASGGSTAGPVAAAFLESVNSLGQQIVPECVVAGSDWNMFQGDITRSGCSEAEPIVTPDVQWRADVGISGWLNSPVVTDGLVVLGSAGDDRGRGDPADGIYAIDLRTGAPRWHFRSSNDVNGVAAYGDLVVATGDEGTVWGLDLATGSQVWRFDAGAPVYTNPLVVDGLVIVGDASGVLWALELDGTERWRAQLDGAIRGGAASDGRLVYAVSDSGDAMAFTMDGFAMWRTRIEVDRISAIDGQVNTTDAVTVHAAPTVADDTLVVTFSVEGGPQGPALVGLDRYVGSVVWWGSDSDERYDFANLRNSAARFGESLIVASSLSQGIQGIDAATGQAIWASDEGVWCEKQWASAVVVSDIVVLPRPDGSVQAFDAVTGETRWRIAPAGTHEEVLISDCVADGKQVGEGFEFHASVAVAPDGTLIVASTSHAIYAIGGSR